MSEQAAFDPTDLDALSEYCCALDESDVEAVRKLVDLQQILADDLIARFQRNIAAFEKHMPQIAKTFKNYRPEKTMEFFCSPNGIPNLMFIKENKIFYKHLDPQYLCRRQIDLLLEQKFFSQIKYGNERDWCGQIHHRYMNLAVDTIKEYKDNLDCPALSGAVPNCVMVGLGLGYQIGMLYERIEIANLVIIEPDLDLFFASLHCFDWAPLLDFIKENKLGLYLLLGADEKKLFDDLYHFYERHGKFLSGFYWCYVHYRSETINKIAQSITRDYNRLYNAMGYFDDHLFAISHACDSILKRKGLCCGDHPLPEDLAEYPVFVIGNGPSLDKDIDFIRRNQDKAVIIACGTAIEALYRAGVQADFYAATERIPQIEQTLKVLPDQSYLDKVILLAGDVIHPYTTALFKHTCIFSKPDEPFFWIMLAVNPKEARRWTNIYLMNPLVGNCGTAAPSILGFRHLYLFGLDNGSKISDEMIYHSRFSGIYNSKIYKKEELIDKIPPSDIVKGNFGGLVHSGPFFKMSVRHMELLFENVKDHTEAINCSDGALIEGTKSLHSAELKDEFDKRLVLDKKRLFDFMVEKKTFTIEASAQELNAMLHKDDYCKAVSHIKDLLANRPEDRLAYVQMLENVSEFIYTIAFSRDRSLAFMLDGTTQSMFILASYCLFRRDDVAQGLRLANQVLDYYVYMLEDSEVLYSQLPDYVLGPHQKLNGGKIGFDHGDCKALPMPIINPVVPKKILDNVVYTPFVKNYGGNA